MRSQTPCRLLAALNASRMLVFLAAALLAVSACAAGIDYRHFNKTFGTKSLKELNSRGWQSIRNNDLDSAAAFYAISISRYSESLPRDEMERVGLALVNTGYIWLFIRNNPEQAYPFLNNALSIGRSHDLPAVKIGAGENLAKIYADYNNYPRAVSLYSEALNEAVARHLDWGVTMTFIDLLSLSATNGRIGDIGPEIATVAAYPFDEAAPMGGYCHHIALAAQQMLSGRFDLAARMLEEASPLLDPQYDTERYQANHRFLTGFAHMKAGDSSRGIASLKEARSMAALHGLPDIMQTVCETLGNAYMAADMPDSAHITRYDALRIRDSLFNTGKYDVIKDLESEAVLSNMRKEITDSRAREEKSRTVVTLVSAGAAVALLLLALLLFNNRRLKASNRELFVKNMELVAVRDVARTERRERPPRSHREELEPVLEKVSETIYPSPEVFSPDFSLGRLSEITGIKTQLISQAIAELTGKNLSALVAERRINRACRLLADPESAGRLTVESIAESVGYKSRTHFSNIFKTHTGLTPTEFIRQARNTP